MRQITVVAILHHADGAVALGELLAVGPENHRQMRELGHTGLERVIDVDLARRIVDVVVAADHFGDVHVDIVDDDGEIVGRKAVRAHHDEIVEFLVVPLDAAFDLVVEHHRTRARVAETNHAVRMFAQRFVLFAVNPGIARLHALVHLRRAHRIEFFARFVCVIRLAGVHEFLGNFDVTIHAQRLIIRAFVMIQPEPVHAVENRFHRFVGGTLAIGVLDAQDELSTAMPRFEPAIQRSARAADVQETGRARSEAGADSHAWGL